MQNQMNIRSLSFLRNSKEPTLMSSYSAQGNLQRDRKYNKILGANSLICKNHRTRCLPSIMVLLAITGGLEVLATLGFTGTIHSDCQGLIRKLLHPHVLRRNTTGPGYPLLRYRVTTLQHHPIQLCWTRNHPERSNVPPHCWDHQQWGILLANRFGGHQPPDHNPDFPSHRTGRLRPSTALLPHMPPRPWDAHSLRMPRTGPDTPQQPHRLRQGRPSPPVGSGTYPGPLLHFRQPLEERGQLWTGLWTPAQRHLIQGALAGYTLRAS